MKDYSYVFNAHPSFIDEMYHKYEQEQPELKVEKGKSDSKSSSSSTESLE